MSISADDWTRLRRLFKDAEDATHEAETLHADLPIAAVNQLRYAGQHILAAQTAEDAASAREDFLRAERHCQRALFDAYDSVAVFLLAEIAQFRRDYKAIIIAPLKTAARN